MPTDVDTDAIERLLAELEGAPNPTSATTRNASAAPDRTNAPDDSTDAAGPGTAAQGLQPWEYNPYANSSEQEKLQNLVDMDALMGRSPAPKAVSSSSGVVFGSGGIRKRAPTSLPPLSTAATDGIAAGAVAPEAATELRVGRDAQRAREAAAAILQTEDTENAEGATEDSFAGRMHPQLEIHAVRPALGSVPPPTRCDHSAVAIDGRIVLFGGVKTGAGAAAVANPPTVGECVAYDESTGGWEPVFAARGDVPAPRSMHGAAAVDLEGLGVPQHVVVVGGRDAAGEPIGDAHVFSLADQQWSALETSGRGPTARFGHSATAIGSRVFVFGGKGIKSKHASGSNAESPSKNKGTASSLQLSSDMYVLDVGKAAWHKATGRAAKDDGHNNDDDETAAAAAPHHPVKRFAHASCAAADGTAIFIHGGVTSNSQHLGDLWKYDIATRGWTEIRRDGGIPRSRHSIFYVDDNLVCVGGAHAAADRASDATFVSSLSVASPFWTNHQLVGFPVPRATRAGHAAAVLHGVLCVHGGSSPAEAPDAMSTLLAVTLSSALLPRSDPLPRGLDAPLVAVAALERCLRQHAVPFDLALDVGTGEGIVGCHAGLLEMRAPRLHDAIAALPHEPLANRGIQPPSGGGLYDGGSPATTTASAVPTIPAHYAERAQVVVTMGSRHREGLPHALPHDVLGALITFLYTGGIPPIAAADAVTSVHGALAEAAKAYGIDHLEGALARIRVNGEDASEPPSPEKDGGGGGGATKPASRRLEAQVLARERLQSTVAALVDDGLSTDCVLELRESAPDDADAAEEHFAVRFHSFVAAGRSEPLRRVLHGLLTPSRRPSSAPLTNAAAAHTLTDKSYTDRQSGLTATWRPSALRSGRDMILIRVGDAPDGRRLPALKSAVVAAFEHMYAGTVDSVRDDNAVEVLMAARALDLPCLAAAAERVIVAHIDAATAMDAAADLNPSELVALLQLGDMNGADHVLSRVTVAAATIFDRVRREPSFGRLAPRVQAYVETVAAQCGWQA